MKNGPYELVLAPEDFPGKRYRNRYCYEHTLVWWKAHGTLPKADEIIHHINHKKRDNRLCNLELKNRAEHSKGHHDGAAMIKLHCDYCEKSFVRELRNVRSKRKYGQKLFFCSISCGTKMMFKLGGRLR